jgi:ABC-type enterochelin transport system substrate-binding protein
MIIFAGEKTIKTMATVTLQYDGRSAAMKKLIELFVTLGGIVTEQKETKTKKGSIDEAIAEYRSGKTYKAKDAHDLIEQCLK